ncbi:MAG: hypothetical protein WB762_12580 [Candidatus Sulfotelmatobacter sp.]
MATVLTPVLRARILSATRKKPSDGTSHWSCRKLATAKGVSKDAVHRVWKEAGLKPHSLERYLASDDPEFGLAEIRPFSVTVDRALREKNSCTSAC